MSTAESRKRQRRRQGQLKRIMKDKGGVITEKCTCGASAYLVRDPLIVNKSVAGSINNGGWHGVYICRWCHSQAPCKIMSYAIQKPFYDVAEIRKKSREFVKNRRKALYKKQERKKVKDISKFLDETLGHAASSSDPVASILRIHKRATDMVCGMQCKENTLSVTSDIDQRISNALISIEMAQESQDDVKALQEAALRKHMKTIAPVCGKCGGKSELIKGHSICPDNEMLSNKNAWSCPKCDMHVWCHDGSIRPKGTLSDAKNRRLRREAHEVFDVLWIGQGSEARGKAYGWLASQLKIKDIDAHFGLFNTATCERVIELIKKNPPNIATL